MTKISYISDLLLEDLIGGGELNDHELCKELIKKGSKLTRTRSHDVSLGDLKVDTFYIISNFVNLRKDAREYIQHNCKYMIYEHDHKYIKSRNPALYKDYKANKTDIVNLEFYKKAKKNILPKFIS